MSRFRKAPETAVLPARLYTHNEDVDEINARELAKIAGSAKVYEMSGHGAKKLIEALKRSLLAPERLVLKTGARVMFVRNNFEVGFVNGTLGVVDGFDRLGRPVVRLGNGKKIIVEPEIWRIDEEGKTRAEVSQLPLRLAWAITVHKSQGMSLDALEVDLSKAFVPGMGYEALSRARSLAGLSILGLNDMALKIDPALAAVEANFRDMSRRFGHGLSLLGQAEKDKLIEKFVAATAAAAPRKKVSTYEETKKLIAEGLTLADVARRRQLTEETIIAHLEKLIEQFPDLEISHLKPAPNRLIQIKEAFKKAGNNKLTMAKNHLPASFSFKDVRLGRLFLNS